MGHIMRAAIYARVSTDDQARDGFSIAAQLKRLNAYCKARGWALANEYVDEGFSGRGIERPAYQLMMSEIESWDVLVVLKMDRIHRNSRNFTNMMDLLKERNKEFNSMQESFDTTTAIGRFVMDIIQRIAQLESEQIGERVKMGMAQKAKKGKGHNGFPEPYGYRFNDGHLTVVDTEAIVVETIFHRYMAGSSLMDIASDLNEHGISTKKGKAWEKATVLNVLTNPIYCGTLLWDGIEQQRSHPAIIEISAFLEVERLLKMRRRRSDRTDSSKTREEGGVANA
jgi:DNA invertase Pin-like site-specific DNA recombinase